MKHITLAYTSAVKTGRWYGIASDAEEAERRLRRYLNRRHPRLTFTVTLVESVPVE